MLVEKGILSSTSQKVLHFTKMNTEDQKYDGIAMKAYGTRCFVWMPRRTTVRAGRLEASRHQRKDMRMVLRQ